MGDTIAQYLGDTPSPNLADRVGELERIVSDLFARVAGANQTAVQTIAKSGILTEAELCVASTFRTTGEVLFTDRMRSIGSQGKQVQCIWGAIAIV
ncbi:hypothetical protein NC981_00740 [Leptolyngbya sp. DQ-M1]|uniref:hypothetical protein n=1 Tax=Leptolyngbya sp. DQ-M1 TaxID=2933920 RepID=UPI003299B01C